MSLIFNCNHDNTENDIAEETLILDKTPNAECAFQGYFQGYQRKMVAVTTQDCPITGESNFLMTFWVPELCDKSTFFEAFRNGTGFAYQPENHNLTITHDSLETPIDFKSELVNKRQIEPAQSFALTDEFKVKLRIYYDDKFDSAFGNTATER